jgi:SLOG cluster4 family
MHIRGTNLIALYDATNEQARLGNMSLPVNARELGKMLAKADLGVISRVGSPVILSVLSTVRDEGGVSIGLSPAASRLEHVQAFRLPEVDMPVIYMGRGALGTDVAALASAKAVVIINSDEEAIDGILGCIGQGKMPIAILTDEKPIPLREKIAERYSWALPNLIISEDPSLLIHELRDEIRKKK